MLRLISALSLILLLTNSCTVSFINVGIDYTKLKTFSIAQFTTTAANAPPTSGQQFSEQLKNKVLNNTRLTYVEDKGDVQFTGNVVDYSVKALAPQAAAANQTVNVALQRLTIKISVDCKNITEKDNTVDWNQQFSRFADFAAEEDLASVEDQLIEEIYEQVIEDVFNKAFAGW